MHSFLYSFYRKHHSPELPFVFTFQRFFRIASEISFGLIAEYTTAPCAQDQYFMLVVQAKPQQFIDPGFHGMNDFTQTASFIGRDRSCIYSSRGYHLKCTLHPPANFLLHL